MQGLEGAGKGVSQEHTPSSRPNSSNQASRAGVQHMSSSGHTSLVCPSAQPPSSGPQNIQGQQAQHYCSSTQQQSQQLQANGTPQHRQGLTATAPDSPSAAAAQAPMQLMQQQQQRGGSSSPGEQQLSAADDEAATGEDMDDEFPDDEEGSPQSEVGLADHTNSSCILRGTKHDMSAASWLLVCMGPVPGGVFRPHTLPSTPTCLLLPSSVVVLCTHQVPAHPPLKCDWTVLLSCHAPLHGQNPAQVGLELLGAVAAAGGPAQGDPRSATSPQGAAAAAAAGAAEGEAAGGAQAASYAGQQKGRGRGGAGGAGASGAALVCQVRKCWTAAASHTHSQGFAELPCCLTDQTILSA